MFEVFGSEKGYLEFFTLNLFLLSFYFIDCFIVHTFI